MFIRNERSIQEFFRLYPVVSILVLIHLVLWLSYSVVKLQIGTDIFNWGIGHNFSVLHGEYWRLVTPIFLHIDLGHVVFNSFALVIFGPALERMVGKGMFIFIYLFTGIAANIGTYFIEPTSMIPHLGASGAIYGLLGLYIYMTAMRKDLIDAGSARVVTIILIIGLVMTFIRPNINIAAHIFGFIAGFAIGPITLRKAVPYLIATMRANAQQEKKDPGFNPNRWKRKRRIPRVIRKNMAWIIFILIVLIGFFARYF